MARYRKIDTRMWGDSRFRRLSSGAKYLWIFLLTGPHTTNLPGLSRGGQAGLAEELGTPLEEFQNAFGELIQEGLVKADWNARVIWIPNAIKYNSPENPNVVRGWRDSWDEVPECLLKAEAYTRFKAFTEALGGGFAKAFLEVCAKGLANQEQEQEQEQEQKKTLLSEPNDGSDWNDRRPSGQQTEEAHSLSHLAPLIYDVYPRKAGRKAALKAISKAILDIGAEKKCSRQDAFNFIYDAVVKFRESPAGNKGEFTPHCATWMNQGRYFDDPVEWYVVNTNGTKSNGTPAHLPNLLADNPATRALAEMESA